MMNRKDLTIGVLSVTAVVLLTGLVIVQSITPQQAMAIGQSAASGDYLVTTSQVNDYTELVIVLDTVAMKMNAYIYQAETGQVVLLQPPIPVLRPAEKPPEEPRGRR